MTLIHPQVETASHHWKDTGQELALHCSPHHGGQKPLNYEVCMLGSHLPVYLQSDCSLTERTSWGFHSIWGLRFKVTFSLGKQQLG